MVNRLFHVSENPNIELFVPLPAPNKEAGVEGSAVWAIDSEHLPNYLLPRDCPRITYALSKNTSDQDRKRFFEPENENKRVIIVEDEWIHRIQETTLYLYEFDPGNFELLDAGAGYYISRQTEAPTSREKIDRLIEELKSRNVILKTLPNLWGMIDEVARSSLEFSIIRKRNAIPRIR